jgi:ABC-type phosphate transport system substrate-binding protein
MKKIIMLTIMFSLIFSAASQAGAVIVIANKNVAAASISAADLERIFLGKKASWDNGQKLTLVVQKTGKVREVFLKEYLSKNPSQYDIYWKQALFTGTGRPPKALSSDEEMVQYVSSTDGAIGYIDSDTPHDGVKKLDVK